MQLSSDFSRESSFHIEPSQFATIDSVCTVLNLSPLKRESKDSISRRAQITKRKFDEIVDNVHNVFSELPTKIIPMSSLELDKKTLIVDIKNKLLTSKCYKEKIQLLTLVPSSWTVEQIFAEFSMFNVSVHAIRKAKELYAQQGILPTISNNRGRRSDATIDDIVTEFYLRQDISRECPGMKDVKSVKIEEKRELKQKRLLLDDLKDIFLLFKEERPDLKIGFSRFASLRPPWCVLAGSQGTLTVCVCMVHQNVKLMMQSIKCHLKTDDLISKAVCAVDREICMTSSAICKSCPTRQQFEAFVESVGYLASHSDIYISYQQWVKQVPHFKLITVQETSGEFLEHFSNKVFAMKKHHYIAKNQSKFLRDLKNSIDLFQCIVLCDFAENYSFIVQDAIQSFHWDNSQATLHPFTCYYCESPGTLKCYNSCVISNCMEHDAVAVHAFLKIIIPSIKEKIPNLQKIFYFSDGAGAQYKNKKNFTNLLFHEEDFGVKAEWHFFATSHGKSPCDGIGGTIKRMARRASLQRTTGNQILTPMDLFKYAKQNIQGIQVFFVDKLEKERVEIEFKPRYSKIKTIKDTRTYHSFCPVNNNSFLRCRVCSSSSSYKDFKLK